MIGFFIGLKYFAIKVHKIRYYKKKEGDFMYFNQLTNEEKLVVNSEVAKKGKSVIVAILLALFFGTLGIHRFYLGQKSVGVSMAILTISGWLTFVFLIGMLPLAITGMWAFVDLFLVPKIVATDNQLLEEKLACEMITNRP